MSKLVSVGGGHSFSPEAAASWARMVAEKLPTGGLTSSTRSLTRQWELYNNRGKAGWPKYVAHPNESKHVWRPDDKNDRGGRAADVSASTRTWMIQNAAAHGWYRPWPTIEPWHFEYVIKNDRKKDEDMPITKAEEQAIADRVVKTLLATKLDHTAGQRGVVDRKSSTVERALSDTAIGGFASWKRLPRIQAQLSAQAATIAALSKSVGVDPARVERIISEAVDAALADIEITLTVAD